MVLPKSCPTRGNVVARSFQPFHSLINLKQLVSPRRSTSIDSTSLSQTGKTPSWHQYLLCWQLNGILPDSGNSLTCISAISLFKRKDNARRRIPTLGKVKKG